MRKKFLLAAALAGMLVSGPLVGGQSRPAGDERNPQENPPAEITKPQYDYMSSFLARSTQPLGLKDAPEVRKLLDQKTAKWVIRSGRHQILD